MVERLGDGDGRDPSTPSHGSAESDGGSPSESAGSGRPPRETVLAEVNRCIGTSDDPDNYRLEFVIPTPGKSQYLWFFVVGWTIPHPTEDGLVLHKLRYFQFPTADAPDSLSPTFKKNGMSMRGTPDESMWYALGKGAFAARTGDTPAYVDDLVSDDDDH